MGDGAQCIRSLVARASIINQQQKAWREGEEKNYLNCHLLKKPKKRAQGAEFLRAFGGGDEGSGGVMRSLPPLTLSRKKTTPDRKRRAKGDLLQELVGSAREVNEIKRKNFS